MANTFTQTNTVILDKILNVDVWPNQVFFYKEFSNIKGKYNKIGGEFTRKYMKTPSEFALTQQGDTSSPTNPRSNASELNQTRTMGITWNTLNFNTPIYETYSLESVKLRGDLGKNENSSPGWENYIYIYNILQ